MGGCSYTGSSGGGTLTETFSDTCAIARAGRVNSNSVGTMRRVQIFSDILQLQRGAEEAPWGGGRLLCCPYYIGCRRRASSATTRHPCRILLTPLRLRQSLMRRRSRGGRL